MPKHFEPTNWVYMFHLPYNLDEIPSYRTYIKGFVETIFGEIDEIHFFNYKEFFEVGKTKNNSDPTELESSLRE